jgi:hypothetical protein
MGHGWGEETPGGALGARADALCTGAELSNPKRANQNRELAWPWGYRHHNQWHDKDSDAQGSTRQPAAMPSPLLFTQQLGQGQAMRAILKPLGHQDVSTTMTDRHGLNLQGLDLGQAARKKCEPTFNA